MNNYETVFIMNPVLSDEQVRETVKKFIDYLKSKKATISHEENWGLKKLKYVIQKKKTGFYYLIEFQADGSIIGNFEVEFQRDEILRGLNLASDEDYIIYSDNDEIPNLENINFLENKSKLILFRQNLYYYKFNLAYPKLDWYGSKACKKKI